MKKEQLDMLRDAWYVLRDVQEEVKDARLFRILGELHNVIDEEYETRKEMQK